MTRLLASLCCLLFTLCTAPPAPLVQEMLPSLFLPFEPPDSVCLFEAFGETKFAVNGQRFGAPIEIRWKSDRDFKVEFYSPFGGPIASIASGRGGMWDITIGDSLYKKLPRENVGLGRGFMEYPFTYEEFLHILTGGLLDYAILKKNADSIFFDGKKGFCYWLNADVSGRRCDVSAIINRKQSSVTDVIYRIKNPASGELAYSSFKGGVPKEIRFSDPSNNYFYLNYDRIFRRAGASECRKER
jgi:hypothetical protein